MEPKACIQIILFTFEIKATVVHTHIYGFKDNSQVVELSGQPDMQIVVNPSLHTVPSPFFLSESVCRTPHDQFYVSYSQEMYIRTLYPCPVCARNATSREVTYLCNRCSGCVDSKCSGLQNAASAVPRPLYGHHNIVQ